MAEPAITQKSYYAALCRLANKYLAGGAKRRQSSDRIDEWDFSRFCKEIAYIEAELKENGVDIICGTPHLTGALSPKQLAALERFKYRKLPNYQT